jgi:hypothetical protein
VIVDKGGEKSHKGRKVTKGEKDIVKGERKVTKRKSY